MQSKHCRMAWLIIQRRAHRRRGWQESLKKNVWRCRPCRRRGSVWIYSHRWLEKLEILRLTISTLKLDISFLTVGTWNWHTRRQSDASSGFSTFLTSTVVCHVSGSHLQELQRMRTILDQRGPHWDRCPKGAVGRESEGNVECLWHSAAKEDAGFQQHDTVCHYELYAINLTVLVCAEGASTALHVWLFGEAFWEGASCPASAIITKGLSGVVPKLPAMVHIGFGIWHLAFACCIQCFFMSAFACQVCPFISFLQIFNLPPSLNNYTKLVQGLVLCCFYPNRSLPNFSFWNEVVSLAGAQGI